MFMWMSFLVPKTFHLSPFVTVHTDLYKLLYKHCECILSVYCGHLRKSTHMSKLRNPGFFEPHFTHFFEGNDLSGKHIATCLPFSLALVTRSHRLEQILVLIYHETKEQWSCQAP